eukprot:Lankesteria_metandrocarpae@DN5450_c0_g1_i11.p3
MKFVKSLSVAAFLRVGSCWSPIDWFNGHRIRGTTQYFDHIVVGGGAAGCPLARTLAESGKQVLLIERGGPRTDHPYTLDIFGGGLVLNDTGAAQKLVTSER